MGETARQELRVEVDGHVVAESSDVIRVDEDQHPRRGTSTCASETDPSMHAAWTCADPYDEHRVLEERIAFHESEMSEIELAGAR